MVAWKAIRDMVSEVDLGGDGEISFDEFATGTGVGKAAGRGFEEGFAVSKALTVASFPQR